MDRLPNYEINFEKEILRIDMPLRQKAGALLLVVPNHVEWDDFLATVKSEWWTWKRDLARYPDCLVVLYVGLAFYEYEDNTLWPQFASAVGSERLPTSQQDQINTAFSKVAERLGLKLQRRENRTDFVGSAVYYIGIPLSLWDVFLEICEWALWQDDWKGLTDTEWTDVITRRAGGRKRLKTFLLDNRQTASEFIQEMHDAREILRKECLPISELKQACLLRPEYFDEVTETAEFLCPQNPESLFQDRARLVWDDRRSCISLYLPAVARNKLPATWRIGNLPPQKSSASPDELVLNSAAFETTLLLRLESSQQREVQRLRGVEPWGLFDMERGGRLVVNPDRDYLPLRSYVLVASKKVDIISREGFEQEENPENQSYELENGTTCYVTNLYPTAKYAKLSLTHVDKKWKLHFRTKSDIKPWFFVGRDKHAANFECLGDITKIERLPLLCVAIPRGYLQHTEANLHSKFRVFIDDIHADGEWEMHDVQGDDREFYFWEWAKKPFIKKVKSGIFHDFKELSSVFKPPNLRGERVITITAPERDPFKYKICLEDPKHSMDECWKNLPGAFLPWFLLCQSRQSPDGMTWDDLLLARDVIAPDSNISYNVIRKYADHGLLKRIGHKWIIAESRMVLTRKTDKCEVKFCGDPSILWGLYRKMYYVLPDHKLPIIEVVSKRGDLPFLLMRWNKFYPELDKYLKDHHVRPVYDLWRC